MPEFAATSTVVVSRGLEDPEVVVRPAEGSLDALMQPVQRDAGRNLEPPPDRRPRAAQRNLHPVYGRNAAATSRALTGGVQGGRAAPAAATDEVVRRRRWKELYSGSQHIPGV